MRKRGPLLLPLGACGALSLHRCVAKLHRSKDPLGPQGAFRIPLLQTWGLDEASLDVHCVVPMETCKVASCIVYEAATVCLTVLVVAQERFSGPKLLRASGGSGRPIRARSVFLQMLLLS